MKYLFFFVHPSKFHVFRKTINHLVENGHTVKVLITSKDILEDLVKKESWDYTNIFPEGRKIKGLSPLVSSGINLFRTIYRLYKYCKGNKYDLLITDDLLVFISKWFRIPSIAFTDDDISATKQFSIILSRATHILAPDITDLGKFNKKKIGFTSYKELAYLHPEVFKPNIDIIKEFNPSLEPYFLIRIVSLRAYHDVGKKGISDQKLHKLISILETKGRVYISAERELSKQFNKYQLNIDPRDISHVLYYADLFVGDSQTMTSEAAVLGTPAFRCNDFVGKLSVMEEKENIYHLTYNYLTEDFDLMCDMIEDVISKKDFKAEFTAKRKIMLNEKIDLSGFMIWLLENYPQSANEFSRDPDVQNNFKYNYDNTGVI